MKKLIFTLALCVGALSFAQKTTSDNPVKFGLKAGLNVSSLQNSASDNNTAKVGFNGGVFANIPLSKEFSLQPELIYNGLGGKNVINSETNLAGINTKYKREYTTRLGYIAMPVMLQYRFTPKFYVEAGPEFGILVDASQGLDLTTTTIKGNSTTTTSEKYAQGINDQVKKVNFGLSIGAGYDFNSKFGINARYTVGLNNISKSNSANSSIKNKVFQIGVNYKFK